MLIQVVEASAATFAEQIAAQIRLGIARGEVRLGERLPAAKELATSLGVNMHTVLRAYDALREAGVVDLRRGRGAVVVGGDRPAERSLLESASALVAQAASAGVGAAELSSLIRGMA